MTPNTSKICGWFLVSESNHKKKQIKHWILEAFANNFRAVEL
jgi:hypothetical protein